MKTFSSFLVLAVFSGPVCANDILTCIGKQPVAPRTEIECFKEPPKEKGNKPEMTTTLEKLNDKDYRIAAVIPHGGFVMFFMEKD